MKNKTPSEKLTDSQYELARMSNMPMETEDQCEAIRKYEAQCEADTKQHSRDQKEDADEQVGQ
jgi:hypothetical protein